MCSYFFLGVTEAKMKITSSASFSFDESSPVSDDDDKVFDSEEEFSEEDNKNAKRRKISKQSSKKTKTGDAETTDEPRKRRLGKNDKLRLKRKQIRDTEKKELMLNAREIIPFGERADAPPKFTGEFGRAINAAGSQAGKKDLLLKSLLGLKKESEEKVEETMETSAAKNQRLLAAALQRKRQAEK